MRWLPLFLLLLCAPSLAWADDVFDPLLEQLLRLPDHDARKATIVQKLGELGDDPLSKERLGSALSVIGALDADKRTSEYVVRLFLSAALDPDPEVRDEAIMRARRGLGPPAGDDTPKTDEAARAVLDARWLTLRERPLQVRQGSEAIALQEFVTKVGDGEIEAVLRREERRSWGVFGATVGIGVGFAVGGVLTTAGANGELGSAPADPTPGRTVGGALIGVGAGAVIAGLVQRAVVSQRHRRGYRRYYAPERLRELVDAENAAQAERLGVEPETD